MTPARTAPQPSSGPAGAASDPTSGRFADLPRQRVLATGVPLDLAALQPADGALIAAGTSTDVFAVDDNHVLRRYRDGHDATAEVAVLRHVAAHGFPAPEVVAARGPDLLLERLHGPTLLQALAAGEVTIGDGAQILADLHRRLHALPVPGETAPDHVLVHLDLHPANVVLTEGHGPFLIDWAAARTGPAVLDVALTALVVAEVAVDAGGTYSQAARAMLAAFLAAVEGDVVGTLEDAVTQRLSDPALVAGERELVPTAAALVRRLVTLEH